MSQKGHVLAPELDLREYTPFLFARFTLGLFPNTCCVFLFIAKLLAPILARYKNFEIVEKRFSILM